MEIYDLTVALDAGTAVYPGDPAFGRKTIRLAGATLSELKLGSHTGTHVDAAAHLMEGGWTLDEVEAGVLVGSCAVRSTRGVVDGRALRRYGWEGVERVLLRTTPAPRGFLTADAAGFLAAAGVRLVGIDRMSVDAPDAGGYPAHLALLGAGVLIVENLNLAGVPDGEDYRLFCGPLRISGGDGAPARVLLIRD